MVSQTNECLTVEEEFLKGLENEDVKFVKVQDYGDSVSIDFLHVYGRYERNEQHIHFSIKPAMDHFMLDGYVAKNKSVGATKELVRIATELSAYAVREKNVYLLFSPLMVKDVGRKIKDNPLQSGSLLTYALSQAGLI
jgi:hypothetical protein